MERNSSQELELSRVGGSLVTGHETKSKVSTHRIATILHILAKVYAVFWLLSGILQQHFFLTIPRRDKSCKMQTL